MPSRASSPGRSGALSSSTVTGRCASLWIVTCGRKGKVLELARHPALDDGRVVVAGCAGPRSGLRELALMRSGLSPIEPPSAVEHDVGVEGELAGRGDDPGVMDVQVELVHRRHGYGEEVVLVGRINEDLRAALELALGGFLDQHQRATVGWLLQNRVAVPGHVACCVTQEVVIAQLRPQLLDVVGIGAAAHQNIQGGASACGGSAPRGRPGSPGHGCRARLVSVYSWRNRLARQEFHSVGLVALMSATVSTYR